MKREDMNCSGITYSFVFFMQKFQMRSLYVIIPLNLHCLVIHMNKVRCQKLFFQTIPNKLFECA